MSENWTPSDERPEAEEGPVTGPPSASEPVAPADQPADPATATPLVAPEPAAADAAPFAARPAASPGGEETGPPTLNEQYPTNQFPAHQVPAPPYHPGVAYPPGTGYPPSPPYPTAGHYLGGPTPSQPAGWGAPPSSPWSAAPGGTPPPPGGWGAGPTSGWPHPGYTDPAAGRPSRNRGIVATMVALVLAVAVLAGVGVGYVTWSNQSSANSATNPGGSSGNGLSPFGGGSNGTNGNGSSGNSSTGAGAPSDISSIASKVNPALVDINTNLSYQNEQAAGTGMVLTSNGEILTNNHVIDGATSISATDVGNGKTYTATVVGYDRSADVAVIQLQNASGLQTVTTTNQTPSVGQAVVGIGNAGGAGGTPSTAGGSITALNQSITASDSGGANAENLTGLIEINANIQPGDSGGALVNTSSRVIGMDTAAAETPGFQVTGNQAYAIPITTALSLARQIEAGQASSSIHIGTTAFLGIEVQPSSTSSNNGGFNPFGNGNSGNGGGNSSTNGAVVEGVVPNGAAAQAGLAQGDVITGFNGHTISTATDISNLMIGEHPGDTVQLQWTDQSGQTHTASVKLGNGPPT